jgi:serine/threonine protein kinase
MSKEGGAGRMKRAASMNDRAALAEEIFQEAADVPVRERAAVVAARCGADARLRAEVESLLAQLETTGGGFLEDPAFAASPGGSGAIPVPLPERLGHYQIIRLIGQGGMGVVYEAEQENPRRRVALKVIRPGLVSPSLLARFRREARALGQLKHPGIAQIYEAGTLPAIGGIGSEQPYLAMELVEGRGLDEYSRTAGLNARARLELVARVCDAVQHAHERGVVHRDLKPGNILVEEGTGHQALGTREGTKPPTPVPGTQSPVPTPKILDFGIARITDAATQAATLQTDVGQLLGTLPYMSPEQLGGGTGLPGSAESAGVDQRSDVYALGVILYELLGGRLPHELRGKAIPEAARIVRDEEPTRLGSVDTRLRGDVETIVAKALEKEAGRRYQSAADLAADIRRYLRDEPIAARPANTMYQLRKFARRHKGLVAGVAAAFAALLAGLVASTVLYLRADRARTGETLQRRQAVAAAARAEALSEYLVKDVLQAAAPDRKGYEVKVVDVLKDAAAGVGKRFAADPALEGDVRSVLAGTFSELGLWDAGIEQARTAAGLLESALGRGDRRTVVALKRLGILLHFKGIVEEAETVLRDAVARSEAYGEDDELHLDALGVLGENVQSQGRFAEGQELLTRALAGWERSGTPDGPSAISDLTSLASIHAAQDHYVEAERLYRDVLERSRRTYGPESPATVAILNDLVNCLSDLHRYEDAAPMADQLASLTAKVYPQTHPQRAYTSLTVAVVFVNVGRLSEAEVYLLGAVDGFERAFGPDSFKVETAVMWTRAVYERLGRPEEALRWHRRQLAIRCRAAGPGEGPGLIKLVQEFANAADALKRDPSGEVQGLLKEVELSVPAGNPRRARALANIGRVLMAMGTAEDVRPVAEVAEKALGFAGQPEEDRRLVYTLLADCQQALGEKARAEEYRAKADAAK